jgi:hypothetical protein
LLNGLPNVVALHEPMNVASLTRLSSNEAVLSEIEDFFASTRRRIAMEGHAPSKQLDGEIPDNQFTDRRDPNTGKRLRHRALSQEGIRVSKPLSDGHTLVIKQPAVFTALLEVLASRYPTYAVIRNPLAVLRSWNSLDISLSSGRLPPAENLCPQLAIALGKVGNSLDRQVFLLNWFFEQYERFLPASAIIRYELLVDSGGAALARVVPAASSLREALENRNDNPVYENNRKEQLIEALGAEDGACWRFYDPKQFAL